MKKFALLNSRNRQRCGKALLAGSLLLVAVGVVLGLPAVQTVFFPGSCHAVELKLARHECGMIAARLVALRADVAQLQKLAAAADPPASLPDPAVRPHLGSGWPAAFYRTRKDRVYVLQKLNYINAKLKAMQGALARHPARAPAAGADQDPHRDRTLAQIQQIQARCRKFAEKIAELSQKITASAGHCE
jgi:hypothetical protein